MKRYRNKSSQGGFLQVQLTLHFEEYDSLFFKELEQCIFKRRDKSPGRGKELDYR